MLLPPTTTPVNPTSSNLKIGQGSEGKITAKLEFGEKLRMGPRERPGAAAHFRASVFIRTGDSPDAVDALQETHGRLLEFSQPIHHQLTAVGYDLGRPTRPVVEPRSLFLNQRGVCRILAARRPPPTVGFGRAVGLRAGGRRRPNL